MDSVNMVHHVEEDGDDTQGVHGGPSQTQSTDGKKRKSDIWDHFVIFTDENNKQRARCIRCEKHYASGSSSHGTTNLIKHFNRCTKRTDHDVSQMHLNHATKLRARKIDHQVYRDKWASAIMKHNYPFTIVEDEGLRDIHSYLNSEVKSHCRNTAKADCLKLFGREKEKLKLSFERIPGRICLTSDCWTSITGEGYICLTAHFVDENWVLCSKIINFSHMPPPHTGVALSEEVFQFLREWGIEKKIMTLTLDNASNCDNMQEYLKLRMETHLLCKGEYFHVRCSAHVLNLIVQDGLKVASEALRKIRDSVRYVKGSEGRRLKFLAACEQVGVSFCDGLRIDVSTRWNSTQFMLECVLKYRKAFVHYKLIEPGYCYCPSDEEWERSENICKFLKPFAEITKLLSGSDYPTSNLYFQNVWKIQLLLLEERESRDEVISAMAMNMLEKFKKYWKNYLIILALAIVLDPRYKLIFVEFCYKKVDNDNCNENVKKVRDALYSLFQEYVKSAEATTQNATLEENVHSTIVEDDISEFDHYEELDRNKSELDLYLEEPRIDRKQSPNLDILVYWKNNCARYPILSNMARDVMAIPITTVASESAFSIGAKVLTKYRSSLLPENAQALICTRNWLCGYYAKSDEPTDDQLVIPLTQKIQADSRGSAS